MEPSMKSAVHGQLGLQGYYGFGNIGDEALLLALVLELRRTYDAERLVVFTARPRQTTAMLGVRAVHHTLPTTPEGWVRGTLGRSRKHFFQSVSAFRHLDWLILGGGGVLKDLPRTSRHFLEILARIEWAKRLGHRVAILGVGAGPFHHPESVAAARRTLPKVDVFTVRDEYSRARLLETGVPEQTVQMAADLAFLLEPGSERCPIDVAGAVTTRGAPGPHIAVCARAVDLKTAHVMESFSELIRLAVHQLGASVWLVPFQEGGGEDDRAGALQLQTVAGPSERLRVLAEPGSPQEMLAFFSQMDMVIGEKLHSLVLALLVGTPVLGISYQPKVECLFAEIGKAEWCVKLADLTPGLLTERFRELWERRLSARELIPGVVGAARMRAQRSLQMLNRCIAANEKGPAG
jgi:polysaccharide pyruvyl transferase CsaB